MYSDFTANIPYIAKSEQFIAETMCTQQLLVATPPARPKSDLTVSLTAESPKEERTFHLFSHLPIELRFKIWRDTFAPRNVLITYSPQTGKCSSSTPLPATLSVNREARYETLRYYRQCFATKIDSTGKYIIFNPRLDTLYFPRRGEMGYDASIRDFSAVLSNTDELNLVRRIALDVVQAGIKRPWEAYDKAVLIKSFPLLQTLVLVLKKKEVWLSNLPRDFLAEKRRGAIEFRSLDSREEAEKVEGDFRMQFANEEEELRRMWASDGVLYERRELGAIEVVEKRRVGGEGR